MKSLRVLPAAMVAGACVVACQSNPSVAANAPAQSQTGGELNVHELSRITLPSPKGVTAKQKGDHVVVEWTSSPQKRVVEYKIFLIDEKDGKATEVGRTKDTTFVVNKKIDYSKFAFGVAAVDYRGNESAVSPPVKTDKKGTAK